ncbi:MAG: hypothetical protein H7Y88_09665 [Phycisphaerales bacterium]|nr:hypothetical protein [Phycisphaerales bacterium]
MYRKMLLIAALSWNAAALIMLGGCDEKKADAPAAGSNTKVDDHSGHDHGHEHADGHDAARGGTVIALGEQMIGSFTATATRDEGQIVAGTDAPIDVTISPAAGSTAKVIAVRFWIGTEDGKGSVKAKADIENPAEPHRWHTHAEIPNPLPPGSRLWVEIESEKGATATGGFDLKN